MIDDDLDPTDTLGLTVDPPDFGAIGAAIGKAAREAARVLAAGMEKLARDARTQGSGLRALAHEIAFRAHARTCGERVCSASHDAPTIIVNAGRCPTCGAAV